MCGISGIYSAKQELDKDLVNSMRDILSHRGPDDFGSFFDDRIALSHRRLSVIDLSTNGHQPMFNSDKTICLVFNGEIYNYIELRDALIAKGHNFVSETDTEVIIKTYEEYGFDCLKYFNGMFAFALWDKNTDNLFCARDKFGEKPFYYFLHDNDFVFASEIKSILIYLESKNFKKEINENALSDYIYFGLMDHNSDTFFRNIKQLPPSHYLVKSEDSIEINNYYKLENKNLEDLIKPSLKFKTLFENSIKLRLRSDVKVGALLSGGIDSASLASIVDSNNKQSLENPNNLFKTFTSASLDANYDESKFVDLMVEEYKISNKKIYPSSNKFITKLRKIIWHHDEPILGTSIYAHWHLMSEIKNEKVTVFLHGQGADEFLCGYDYHYPYFLSDYLSNFKLTRFLKLVKRYCDKNKISQLSLIRSSIQKLLGDNISLKLSAAFSSYSNVFNVNINSPNFNLNQPQSSRLLQKSHSDIFASNMPYILHYEDRNSMAFSLESRAPYLDSDLAEFMFSLPINQKISGTSTKIVLRKSMKGNIPEAIRKRKDKMGFVTPMDEWIKDSYQDIKEIFLSKKFRNRAVFNHKILLRILENYHKGEDRIYYRNVIWKALCIELWLREFLDQRVSKNINY